MEIFSKIDMKQNEILNPTVHNLKNPPLNPVNGQMYYNTQSNCLMCYSEGIWKEATTQAMSNDEIENILNT